MPLAGAGDLPSRLVPGDATDRRWWTVFHDPVLDRLIDVAMDQSFDVQEAGLRIAQARALRDAAAGAYYPSVQANGVAARLRSGAGGIGQLLGGSSGGASGGNASSGGDSGRRRIVGLLDQISSRSVSMRPGSPTCSAVCVATSRPPMPMSCRPRNNVATRRCRWPPRSHGPT